MADTATCSRCKKTFPAAQVRKDFAGICPQCLVGFMAGGGSTAHLEPTLRSCPDCGNTFSGETHVDCPGSKGKSRGTLDIEPTIRKCPKCGDSFSGEQHEGCPGSKGHKGRPHGGPSHLDDLPAEVRPLADDPQRQLNQYILVKQIGKGGMGTVWKAWDRKLTRWLAIKFLLANDEMDVLRFQREAKLAARLRHPNIAPVYEVGEAPAQVGAAARPYLAMEFIEGQTLGSAKLTVRQAVEIFQRVAQGIEAAHKAGVIHRDLKPQNVMLTGDLWPYVMDFGLAKSLEGDSSLSVSGAVMGTPAFMPPEQARGKIEEVDARSDVYSLGATMYAVLTGNTPFVGSSAMEIVQRVLNDAPAPPRKANPEIPEDVETIILKAMARDRGARYPSAAALADDLGRYLSNQEIDGRRPKRRKTVPAILALVAAAASVAGYIAFKPPPPKEEPKPPVSSPVPAPNPAPVADGAARRAEEWSRKWSEERRKLLYFSYQPGETAPIAAQLRDIPPGEVNLVKDWFRGQLDDARREVEAWSGKPRAEWPPLREKAARAVRWCAALEDCVKEVPDLGGLAAEAAALREKAEPVAAYAGTFTLRVHVMGASVASIRNEKGTVPLAAAPETPYYQLLDVADYTLDLTHADGTKEAFSVKGAAHGRTCTVVGKAKALRLESE